MTAVEGKITNVFRWYKMSNQAHSMGFRALLGKAISSTGNFLTSFGAKAVTGPIKDVSGAAKDVTGIRKDIVETKLADLKLKQEESLIQKASLDDVAKYDPKHRDLRNVIGLELEVPLRVKILLFLILILVILLFLELAIAVFGHFSRHANAT